MKPIRKCRVCGKEAHSENELDFFVKDKNSKHNRANCCLDCRRVEYSKYDSDNSEARNAKGIEYYKTNGWEANIKRRYGIDEKIYNHILEQQDFSCKICGTHISHLSERLAVDHSHTTGKVRGLLCRHCNLLLGNASDAIEILENAIKYLKESN